MMSSAFSSAGTEQIVRDYFGSRPNWKVVKLDLGKVRAADYRICDPSHNCFLGEVKTVESVRANYPGTPIEYHLAKRKRRQKEIEEWIKENPDRRLILPPGEFEFIYGDEGKFRAKYRNRSRSTEEGFKTFAQEMRNCFSSASVSALPYSLRLDSQDLYVPSAREREVFFKWLEREIHAISNGNPGWRWFTQKLPYSHAVMYSTSYEIHTPAHENDIKAEYSLSLLGPQETDELEVNIYSYGGLNLDSITTNVERGLRQLKSSALRESDHQMPRVIVLAFASGIGFDWLELSDHIAWLLKNHTDLSAVAVLYWVPEGVPSLQESDPLAWFGAHVTWIPSFIVYHNRWLQDVRPLPVHVFVDKWSTQNTPI